MPLPQPSEIHQLRELFRKARSYADNPQLGVGQGELTREQLYSDLASQLHRFESLLNAASAQGAHQSFRFWATDRFGKSNPGDFYDWLENNSQKDPLLALFLNPRIKDEAFIEVLTLSEANPMVAVEVDARYQTNPTLTPEATTTHRAAPLPTQHSSPTSGATQSVNSTNRTEPGVAENPPAGMQNPGEITISEDPSSSSEEKSSNETLYSDTSYSSGSVSTSSPDTGTATRPSFGEGIQSAIRSVGDPNTALGNVANTVKRGASGLGSDAQIGAKKLIAQAPGKIGQGVRDAFPGIFGSNQAGNRAANLALRKLGQGAAKKLAAKGAGAALANLIPGAGQVLAVAMLLPIPWKKILLYGGIALLIFLLGPFAMVMSISQPRLMGSALGISEGAPTPPNPGEGIPRNGGSCPSPEAIAANRQSPESCRYFGLGVDLFNTSISDSAVEAYIRKYSPIFIDNGIGDATEFKKRVDYIVQTAKTVGLNPVLFLGYWKTESLFSTRGSRDLGCVGDNFYEQVDCALGVKDFSDPRKNPIANCARSKDANSTACQALRAIRSKPFLDPENPIGYPIKTFDDFAEAHGSRAPQLDGEKTNNNCVGTYNNLVEVAIELNACQAGGAQLSPPPANSNKVQLRDDVLERFGVDIDLSFSYEYLKWTWEKLWNVSNSRFLPLVRGVNNNIIRIARSDGPYNQQVSCTQINMSGTSSAGNIYPESLFKVVLVHELAHIIENCSPSANKTRLQEIIEQEGYLTSYSKNSADCAVTRTNQLTENYAETVSYFLNPEYPEQDIGLCPSFKPVDNLNPFKRNVPLHTQFAQELLGVQATQPPGRVSTPVATFSCPVIGGGVNRIPSFQKDAIRGHCGTAYNAQLDDPADRCIGSTRRGKSIDIETGGPNGKAVELPTINNQSVSWKYLSSFTLQGKDCFAGEIVEGAGAGDGCGVGLVFQADLGNGKNWVLHLLHMQPTALNLNQDYPSGTEVGKSQAIHVHISLGQDIQDPMSQTEPGWKSVDQELNVCNSR